MEQVRRDFHPHRRMNFVHEHSPRKQGEKLGFAAIKDNEDKNKLGEYMALYQIMYWNDIPAQVKAQDDDGTAKAMLPERFSEAIDAAAMAEGSTDSADYLDGWAWSDEEERPGSAQEVVDALVAELDAAFPKERLVEMIRSRKGS
jgi:hypothetical protein